MSTAVMLQGFNWTASSSPTVWYDVLIDKVEDMKEYGFTHVWLPPPSRPAVAREGYMPGQLYNLSSHYGNKEQLKALIQSLNSAGIKALADIVINHRCADEQGPDGKYNVFRDDIDHPGTRLDWEAWAITKTDWFKFGGTGNRDTGVDFVPASDLDHTNELLRTGLKDWLNWLKHEIGFSSWRMDLVKGFAPQYTQEYIEASGTAAELNVGEYWVGPPNQYNQDEAREEICQWINGTGQRCSAFDFPTKVVLNAAVGNTEFWRLIDPHQKAPGLVGWWPAKAVTFVANHDTDNNNYDLPFPSDRFEVGYAYILTHPGVPCVFWDQICGPDPQLNSAVRLLMDIRRRNGLNSESKLEILKAEADCYMALVDDKLTVKLGPRYDIGDMLPLESDGWTQAGHGKEWCCWEKKKAA